MTDERLQDENVSAAYREVANEIAPPHLNEKILRMAANSAKPPLYARSQLWTRPLAWAATIAMCLAITLEVTRFSAPDGVIPSTTTTGSFDEALGESKDKANVDAILDGRAAEARDTYEAEARVPASSFAPQKVELAKSRPAARERQERDESKRQDAEEAVAAPALAFEVIDADVMQHVEDLARLQSGTSNEPLVEEISVNASSGLAAPARALVAPASCSDDTKTEPTEWLACIEAFEDAGDTETALREKEALIAVFPDFKMP
jgi:hypothetical protein